MAAPRTFAPLNRLGVSFITNSRPELPRVAFQAVRCASQKSTKTAPKKKKARNTFIQYDLKKAEQFSLIDAMQCVTLEKPMAKENGN